MDEFILEEIKIEVTQRCPLNCLHCSSDANIGRTQELGQSQVISIIDDAKKLGAVEVTLSGGEPLLWHPLSDIVSYCNSIQIPVVVYTSGVPLADNDDLMSTIALYNLKRVVVSLFAASEKLHESITRVHRSFRKTVSAIKKLISARVKVEIHFVAMADNWQKLSEVAALAETLGVSTVSVLRFVPHGRGSLVREGSLLSQNNLRGLRKEILLARSKIESMTIRIGSPFNILLLNDHVNCLAAVNRLIIGPDGKVFPCDAFKNVDYRGNFCSLSQGNLIDIWRNSEYLACIREELKKGLGLSCSSCGQRLKCKGGCLAQKVIRLDNGGALDPDPDCILQG